MPAINDEMTVGEMMEAEQAGISNPVVDATMALLPAPTERQTITVETLKTMLNPERKPAMSNSYTLKTPVTHNGKTYETLTFRKPKTGDLLIMDAMKGELSKSLALYATIADVPLQVIKETELEDFNAMSLVVTPLLGESPASIAGSTS